MAQAEALVESMPDSALNLLDSIDSGHLNSDADRALYALLVTQSRVKLRQLQSDDSLINIATDFYQSKNDPHHLMMAYHYKGRVYYDMNRDDNALFYSLKALDMAEDLGDDRMAAKSAASALDVYSRTYHAAEAIRYAKIYYDYISRSNDSVDIAYAKYEIARACNNGAKYEESIAILDSIKSLDLVNQVPDLRYDVLELLGTSYLGAGQYAKAKDVYETLTQSCMASLSDTIFLAHAYNRLGDSAAARAILQNCRLEDDCQSWWMRYLYYRNSGDVHKALDALEQFQQRQEEALSVRMQQNLSSAITLLRKEDANNAELRLSAEKAKRTYLFCISILLIIIISGGFLLFYRAQKQKMRAAIADAGHLMDELNSKKMQMSSTVREALQSEFEMSDKYFQLLFECNDKEKAIGKVAEQFISRIQKNINTISKSANLEKRVNETSNNIVSRLRDALPNLKEDDYKLFLYSYLGLSSTTIAVLLRQSSPTPIYNRKARLKAQIKKLDEESSELFLRYLK